MTDHQIQIWNMMGAWFSGLATFTAVLISLYLARRDDLLKLTITADIKQFSLLLSNNTPLKLVWIEVVNHSRRPVLVTQLEWTVSRFLRKQQSWTIEAPQLQYRDIKLTVYRVKLALVNALNSLLWPTTTLTKRSTS